MLKSRAAKTYIILGAILILLIFFNYLGWFNFLKSGLRRIFVPLFTKTNEISISVGDRYEFFRSRNDFFDAYRKCVADLQNSEVNAAKISILAEENASLKELLKFREKNRVPMATARVIGKNTESTDQTILIDRGTDEGIKINQPVIVGDGILVGKVVKVESGISTVRLMNDSQFKIAATVLNSARSLGVVEGGYGLSIKMNFIPRNETVMNGDQIITSGLEPNMPRGLLVGTVTAIENETYQPFQAAVLVPVTDLSKLYLVSVLLTY